MHVKGGTQHNTINNDLPLCHQSKTNFAIHHRADSYLQDADDICAPFLVRKIQHFYFPLESYFMAGVESDSIANLG